MKDPVLDKLVSDAGIVLQDLWRIVSHQAPLTEWQEPRRVPAATVIRSGEEPSHSGLCYFHLN